MIKLGLRFTEQAFSPHYVLNNNLLLGKGEGIWDVFCHKSGNVVNNDTGDVACNSYDKFHEDVQLLKDMKVSLRRLFTPSWLTLISYNVYFIYNF